MKLNLLLVGILVLAGCRVASYQAPDHTRVVVVSFLTDPKIDQFKAHTSPTTRSIEMNGYDSKSNAQIVLELLQAVK